MPLDRHLLERLLTTMIRIRRFDERVTELFKAGHVKGTAHSYVGEEAVATGACANLRRDDYIVGTHRGHGHCIAKGASINEMMAELYGKETGYCKGLGGSMHIADMDLNILGCNGVVGAGLPIANGAGLSSKLHKSDQATICFFGDGASSQGTFHESLNLAAVWKLPVVFVCENNQYALSTSYKRTVAVDAVADRAVAYGIPGVTVDGNDVIAVYEAVREAVERARRGEGPSLVEGKTYRWMGHSMRAELAPYRSKQEEEEWIQRDPIARLERELLDQQLITPDRLAQIRQDVEAELEEAVKFAERSPEPTVEVMERALYAPRLPVSAPPPKRGHELTFTEALNEALKQEMRRDPRVFVMGEDVGLIGGIFRVTHGLYDEFGPERARDTPISEATFVGCGLGAAVTGMRPVVEIQIWDFVACAMDQIVNQIAKFRYMLGGKPTVPLVIRGPQGGGIRMAAQHSQSLESWFIHIPGLTVIAPSTPYDAKGLLISAIRDDNPVIFLEHKLLYQPVMKEPVPEEPYALPIGKADIKRAGTHVTIVATQMMVHRALRAAEKLETEGISVEIIDPRTLYPLDEETIVNSIKKTNHLVTVHEAVKRGGVGAELCAAVIEHAFGDLDAPPLRIGARDVPMPYNDVLERATIPGEEEIIQGVREVLA
jgi:2-oxoisovalerate dehydrogenase E1 component